MGLNDVDMLERQLEAMKMQDTNPALDLGDGRSNHDCDHNPVENQNHIQSHGSFSFATSDQASTGNSPGHPVGGVQPVLISPTRIPLNQNRPYNQSPSCFPPLAPPPPTTKTELEHLAQPQIAYEPVQPFAFNPAMNANAPASQTHHMQYPTYEHSVHTVPVQAQTQEPREVFLPPMGLQTEPKQGIWALNSVRPATVGFNWFQAVSSNLTA